MTALGGSRQEAVHEVRPGIGLNFAAVAFELGPDAHKRGQGAFVSVRKLRPFPWSSGWTRCLSAKLSKGTSDVCYALDPRPLLLSQLIAK
jgi:hypothetical protein